MSTKRPFYGAGTLFMNLKPRYQRETSQDEAAAISIPLELRGRFSYIEHPVEDRYLMKVEGRPPLWERIRKHGNVNRFVEQIFREPITAIGTTYIAIFQVVAFDSEGPYDFQRREAKSYRARHLTTFAKQLSGIFDVKSRKVF